MKSKVSKPFSALSASSAVKWCFLLLVTCHLLLNSGVAAVPQWWITRGVINTNLPPDNYAAVNQGQLKHIAYQAALELEDKLPGGMGYVVEDLVSGFVVKTNSNYFPVNGGQLKNIAKPFYDRLIEEGYAQSYPWTETTADDANYAMVNIGQVKNVFSFDLDNWISPEDDSDGDGLNDNWELLLWGDLDEQNGSDDADGDGQSNQQEQNNGTDPMDPENGGHVEPGSYATIDTGFILPQWPLRISINSKGEIVGYYGTGESYESIGLNKGFLWSQGELKWFGAGEGSYFMDVKDINDEGICVGRIFTPESPQQWDFKAAYWTKDNLEEPIILPMPPQPVPNKPGDPIPDSWGTAMYINNNGTVLGRYTCHYQGKNQMGAFRWPTLQSQPIFMAVDHTVSMTGLNDEGTRIGFWGGSEQSFIGNTTVGFGPYGINNATEVVGAVLGENWNGTVYWTNGQVQSIGKTIAVGISDRSEIIDREGHIWKKNPKTGKFKRFELSELYPNSLNLDWVHDISGNGLIAATTAADPNQEQALTLSPSMKLAAASNHKIKSLHLKKINKILNNKPNEQYQATQQRLMLLAPVELFDLKQPGEQDDVIIRFKKDAADKNTNGIAWIEPHGAPDEKSPQMPQLEARLAGGNVTNIPVKWKLEVKYDRPIYPSETQDTVKIPANGDFRDAPNTTWKIYEDPDWIKEINEKEGFFGGEAKLTFKYKDQAEQTFMFSIRGKNPQDDLCKAYIIEQTPDDMDWFTYAIAKSESKAYGGEPYYNQFLAHGGKYSPVPGKEGIPLHGKDSDVTPGGFGLFQVTGNVVKSDAIIPRGEIWNWQENVKAALKIIKSKRTIAVNWMTSQRQQSNIPLPAHTVLGVAFKEGSDKIMEDAVTMKGYNGSSRPPMWFVDNGNAPGFNLNPPKADYYCYWDNVNPNPQYAWALVRYNNHSPPFNYVLRVCEEIEE
jgi:hypothetical protein